MTSASATPWPVVLSLEPIREEYALPHPEPVITISCSSQHSGTAQPAQLTWLELLGER